MRRIVIAVLIATFAFTASALATTGPAGLTLTPGVESLTANWSVKGTEEVASWKIKWRPATEPLSKWGPAVILPATARSYAITGLSVKPYEVLVRAKLTNGKAGGSEKATATPLAKEEPPPSPTNTLGRARVAPDTVGWDSYENSSWDKWVQEHISYLRLYAGGSTAWLNLGVPTEAYRDWPASWEGTYAPLTQARREAFVSQKSAADKTAGYGGEFLDDLNGWSSGTLGYRDNLQDKSTLEPEAAEEGRLTAAVRAEFGAAGVIDCNTQLGDALAGIGSAAFTEDLNSCSIQTKEFGVSQVTSASGWTGFLKWVDTVHAYHEQVRMTGSIPVTEPSFQLNEATYYLITEDVSSFHGDLLWLSKQLPANTCSTTVSEGGWWCGLNLNLGEALAPRERGSNGVWQRRFSAGLALVNEPGNSTQTVTLPKTMHTIAGASVTSVTLSGDQGVVLTG